MSRPCQDDLMQFVSPEPNSGCWLWTGTGHSAGYGKISREFAHRAMYEAVRGEIPDGLHIDHLCRVRCCVNPDHLEPVTQQENILRGEGLTNAKLAQTHCIHGHPLSGDNLYLRFRNGNQGRMCRECSRESDRRRAPRRRPS